MARIRTIKPEVMSDPRAARLSDSAWRLWVCMWMLADDTGRLPADPDMLNGQVFWAKPHEMEPILAELETSGAVSLYEVGGERFALIRNFNKHQKIDRPQPPKYPGPGADSETALRPLDEQSSNGRCRKGREGKGEEGNGVEGKDGAGAPLALLPVEPASGPGSRDLGEPDSAKQRKLVDVHLDAATRVLDELNLARKRAIPGARTLQATYGNLGGIAARLAAKATVEDCLHVIAVYEAEVRGGGDSRWFDQVSPWRPDNFRRALARPRGASTKGARNGGDIRPPPPPASSYRYDDEEET